MERLLALILVMLLLTTGVSAEDVSSDIFGDGTGETVRLAITAGNFDMTALSKVLTGFNEKTGITVELQSIPADGWGAYFQKLQTIIVSGNVPDVTYIALEGYEIFRSNNLLTDVTPYVESNQEFTALVDDNHPNLMAPFQEEGKNYGVTSGWNQVCVHLNTALLKEAGLKVPEADWTLDDLLTYAKAMTFEREDRTKVYGFEVPEGYFRVTAWLYNAGASFFNEDMTECTINSPEAIELMQFFQDCVYKYQVSPAEPLNNAFINNQIGMFSAGRWFDGTYRANNFKDVALQYIPAIRQNKVVFGSGLYCMLSGSKNPGAGYKLACWMGSPESQTLLGGNGIPSSMSAMEALRAQEVPQNSYIYVDSADVAYAVQAPACYGDVEAIWNRYYSQIMANETDAATALNACADEINAVLLDY